MSRTAEHKSAGQTKNRPPYAINALLAASSVLLTLLVVEGTLRLLRPRATAFAGRGLFTADPDLGFRLKPDFLEAGLRVTNAYGLRGEDFPVARPAGELRILALGDSFTFGMASAHSAYPGRLEKKLRDRLGRPVRVINAGVPAYGTDQEYALLRREGFRFEPDVVVLGFFVGNDPTDNCATGEHVCVDGDLVALATAEGYTGRWGHVRLRVLLVLEHSYLFRFLRSRSQTPPAEAPPLAADAFHRYQAGRVRLLAPSWYASAEGRTCWENTARYLKGIQELCASHGASFVAAIIPDSLQVDHEVLEGALHYTGYHREDLDRDLPQRKLAEICAEGGIACIDLLPDMRRAPVPLFLPNDSHLNPAGDQLVADRLFDWMGVSGALRSRAMHARAEHDVR